MYFTAKNYLYLFLLCRDVDAHLSVYANLDSISTSTRDLWVCLIRRWVRDYSWNRYQQDEKTLHLDRLHEISQQQTCIVLSQILILKAIEDLYVFHLANISYPFFCVSKVVLAIDFISRKDNSSVNYLTKYAFFGNVCAYGSLGNGTLYLVSFSISDFQQ